jgi:hypothetical protein
MTQTLRPGREVELLCLKGYDALRARIPPHGERVVVRTGISQVRPVPGELFTLEVERTWVFGHTRYAKGLVTAARLDVPSLGLEPLGLTDYGLRDPEEESWLFEEGGHPVYEEMRAAGPRRCCEMEQVVPEDAVKLEWEEDPILEAVELVAAGGTFAAEELLGDLLTADLRCLDAHAHLAYVQLRSGWHDALERATRHYRVGLAIGELTLGPAFPDLLPWGLIDNRPYLRCLDGHAVCLWRRGDLGAAADIFRRLLWLNPHDNTGARFNLAAIDAGRSWEEATGESQRASRRQ